MLEAIRQQLTQRYEEPHRAYHGMAHIEALLQGQLAHRDLIRDHQAVMLAIWFHDAVYDTHQHDNEERSALLAGDMLAQAGASPALIDSVQRKVRATHRHEWTDGDTDTAVFLDLDLGILAASPDAYDRYAGQVAQEYNWVPEQAYKAGRAKVLQAFVDRPQVYFTPALQALWEDQARANLQREIATLTA
ncbi:MAG: metal-dependent phosphohydrolase [Aquabacterium sp.]|uniref:HD domain-containing protein n=1 Tax=Aquabacterium sp. TaxID=1872578 RepID=UPI0025BD6ADD|nr:N-methyl-D-aspartate receptor NMDAR2C subunit [Aquabacterium sp.]MBI5926995.1 metal-dependent phosphohydrolase [Aquabacterium sp.]